MKLFLLFILFGNLAGLSCAMFSVTRLLGSTKKAPINTWTKNLLGSTSKYDPLLGSKVPQSIKDTLASLNALTIKQNENVEKMAKFKKILFYKADSKIDLHEMENLFTTENEQMHKHYETFRNLEETQHELFKALQKTQGAIEYNKESGKFEYTERSQVTDDILKPLRTELPFQNIIRFKIPFLIKKLSPEHQNMILNYEETMANIILNNVKLTILNYVRNDYVLDNPRLNQMKNKMLNPAIIFMSESQKNLIKYQKTFLEKLNNIFTHMKSKLIDTKLDTEKVKLEGELSIITKELEKLKEISESVTADESAQFLKGPKENINTDNVEAALFDFQEQQKYLHKIFQSENNLDTKIPYLNEEMDKLTECKKFLKENIDAIISTLLEDADAAGVSNYADKKYAKLRNTMVYYVTLYQRAENVEHMYKGTLKYLSENHSLKGVDIPYWTFISDKPNVLKSGDVFEADKLVPSNLISVYFNSFHNLKTKIQEDLNDTNAQNTYVSKLCLLATFVFILAIFITIIKAKI